MRSIDRKCITAWFNTRDLGVKMNNDGAFMTRSLAENYPYVPIFQADLKGPKEEWLALIDLLQFGNINPSSALRALLLGAYLRQLDFEQMTSDIRAKLNAEYSPNQAISLITRHIQGRSNGGSRLLEIAIHSFMQCVIELGTPISCLSGTRNLAPIKPMRSPDKKAGDIGDIQFRHNKFKDTKGMRFIEYAIDAKYAINEIGPGITRVLTHINDSNTPQPYLKRIDFIGLESAPVLLTNSSFNSAVHELAKRGVQLRLSSLGDMVGELCSSTALSTNWVHRYFSALTREDKGYGIVTEITTDWVASLGSLLDSN